MRERQNVLWTRSWPLTSDNEAHGLVAAAALSIRSKCVTTDLLRYERYSNICTYHVLFRTLSSGRTEAYPSTSRSSYHVLAVVEPQYEYHFLLVWLSNTNLQYSVAYLDNGRHVSFVVHGRLSGVSMCQ